ncbi:MULTISPECIES: DUF3027 domain-containing protein [unclassified Arthrobacter]|uniref:DUF3027 domain-containing protein n=1 Tax=unclassified Arthrobacter TaxID=235627 RepID=UPI002E07CD0C|nr:hypothetical protein [Arthrobacter sp. MP_M4]MEC5203669.1 hypothetical protein [Arthrobacter sp. MP_M7]
MTPETDQTDAGEQTAAWAGNAGTKDGSKPRAGVPVWRTGKPDAFLADAVDAARTALEGIAPAEQIGRHLAAKSEGDRLVTHLFESKLAGYGGWQWYAVLTRNSRSKVVTVDELGLLPSEDSVLAPEWIPWAERVRPGDEQGDDILEAAGAVPSEDVIEPEPAAGADYGNADDEEDDDGSAEDDAPEDDSDDADGNADGAGDEYDADDVDDDDDDDDDDSEAAASVGPDDERPAAQAD